MTKFWVSIGLIGLFFLALFIWSNRIATTTGQSAIQIAIKNCTVKKGRLKQTLICEPDWVQTDCRLFSHGICPQKEIGAVLRMNITKAQEHLVATCLSTDIHAKPCKMNITRTKKGRFQGISLHP